MPRKKAVPNAELIERACDAFWQNGYEHLGVRALGDITGLNRFALQTEFGGKHQLFLAVLRKYADEALSEIVEPISQGDLNAIKTFFLDLTEPRKDDQRDFGCLMVNTVVENAAKGDESVRALTDGHYKAMNDAFVAALERTKSNGDLPEDADVVAMAEFLLATAMGIQVYVRMHGRVAAATNLGKIAARQIDCWQESNRQMT